MTAKPTPRPWKKSVSHGSEGPRLYPKSGDLKEDMKFIAMINGRDHAKDEANADYILKAVNTHEELVKVAAAFKAEPCEEDPLYFGPNCLCRFCRARNVLELVEVERKRK